MTTNKHVVIIGGGFAGLRAAKVLSKCRAVRVTIVDRTNHHLFQPFLYQVATAALSPADIARPVRNIFARCRNVEVLQAEVRQIDAERRIVVTSGAALDYDYLVVAAGAENQPLRYAHNGAAMMGLKNLCDAVCIRSHLLAAFERAEWEPDPERQRQLLSFVVVGGGYTGVELAGAVAELSRFTLAREFRRLDRALMRIVLVEAGSRVLPEMSEASALYATAVLQRLGVEVITGTAITAVDGEGVDLNGRHVPTSTVLWAAGVRAVSVPGLPVSPSGRVPVRRDLSIEGHPEIFVAGDMAHFTLDSGEVLPAVAPVAFQQGHYVGHVIRDELAGKLRPPFRYFNKGQLAAIGRSRAVAEVAGMKIRGRLAWLIWVLIHIYYLTDFRNRQLVLWQWAWTYLTDWRGARLILSKELPNELPDRS